MTKIPISGTQLTIGYKKNNPILTNLNFELKPSKLTCLLGENGVGKSTLIQNLCGSLNPFSGEVKLFGKNIVNYSVSEISTKISLVLTDKISADLMTVYELIAIGRIPYTGFFGGLQNVDRQIIDSALQLLKIEHLRNCYISELSDGQLQKALIAKALVQNCPIMILDEPTAFLDFTSKFEIMKLLSELSKNQHLSILVSTHDIDLAMKFADDIWILDKKELISDSVDNILKNNELQRIVKNSEVMDFLFGK